MVHLFNWFYSEYKIRLYIVRSDDASSTREEFLSVCKTYGPKIPQVDKKNVSLKYFQILIFDKYQFFNLRS